MKEISTLMAKTGFSVLSLPQRKKGANKNSNLTQVHSCTKAKGLTGKAHVSGCSLTSLQSDTPGGGQMLVMQVASLC